MTIETPTPTPAVTPTPTPTPSPSPVTPDNNTPPPPAPSPTPEPKPQTPEEKAAAEAEAKKTADAEAAKKANDTKATPFKADEIKTLLPKDAQVDEALATSFTDIVNKFGIPRDAAAALVALQNDQVQKHSEQSAQLWEQTQTQWRDQVAKDTEVGGDKTVGVLAGISKLLDKYGTDIPDLRQAFDITGAGNHPSMVKFLGRIAKEHAEGGPVSGNPGGQAQSQADKLFPNQGKT